MRQITLIRGDGIGQEVVLGTKDIIDSLNLEIEWDIISTPMDDKTKKISSELEKSLSITKVGLKGPLTTPVGEGFRSINVEIRKRFEHSFFIRFWRSIHISLSIIFFLGLIAHIIVVTFFASYVSDGSDIYWWHISK